MNEKGQIVIPKKARDVMGYAPSEQNKYLTSCHTFCLIEQKRQTIIKGGDSTDTEKGDFYVSKLGETAKAG